MFIQIKEGSVFTGEGSDFQLLSEVLAEKIAEENNYLNLSDFIQKNEGKKLEIDEEFVIIVPPADPALATALEKEMVVKFKELADQEKQLKIQLSAITKAKDDLEDKIIDMLKNEDRPGSAPYNGVGYVVHVRGATHASIEKGRQGDVISYLNGIGRHDMVKLTVHSATLSVFVREQLKKNGPLPDGITFYKPEYLRFYKLD